MRTIKLSNFQKTLVVELETDAISDTHENATIHDINTIRGDFNRFVEKGFNKHIGSIINRYNTIPWVQSVNLNVLIIDAANNHTTVLETAIDDFALTTDALDAGTDGVAYEFQIEAEGGMPAYEFSITDGDLPEGLEMNSLGLIKGTPTEDGVFTITITCTDYWGQTTSEELTLTIAA
jgi:hypothetical protein